MTRRIPARIREQQINELPNITFVRWDGEYSGKNTKAVCRCTVDGFEWSARVHDLINSGKGCPECAGKRRWTASERIEQINTLPNITFVRWDGEYLNCNSKVICRCIADSFEWCASVNNLVNKGHGCPQCAGVRRWTADERVVQINTLPNITFVRWDGEYRNAHSKAVCRCDLDGFEWSVSVNHLLNGESGCPHCGGVRRWTENERVSQINNLTNTTFIRWDGGYRNIESKAVCRCDTDGFEWSATVNSLINNGTGCPQCAGNLRRTASECVEQINSLHNITFVQWDGEYRNKYSKAVCRCDVDGFEWSVRVDNLFNNGRGCPACAEHGYNPSKPGTLYALRSECRTMVKIGISNDYQQRHATLKRNTPFVWDCTELLHGDGALIAGLEKAFHGMTEPAVFTTPFDGHTEWRKWDARLPEWFDLWRKMTQE